MNELKPKRSDARIEIAHPTHTTLPVAAITSSLLEE
jgi:hypothetical protein